MTRPLTAKQKAARKRKRAKAKTATRRVVLVNSADYSRRIEFVCCQCLHAVMAADDGPWPRCPRGHGRLTPDDQSLPQPKLTPAQARAAPRPPQRSPAQVDAA